LEVLFIRSSIIVFRLLPALLGGQRLNNGIKDIYNVDYAVIYKAKDRKAREFCAKIILLMRKNPTEE
jgi:hypothetical protein